MSNYGPWSVKGSDERAREAAREAAREEGLTIGEYINRMLKMETDGPGGTVSGSGASSRTGDTPRLAAGGGDGGGGDYPGAGSAGIVRDLLGRLEAVEARSAVALSGIDRSIMSLTERLEDAQRRTDGLSSNYETVIEDIRSTHDALRSKLESLENGGDGRRDVKALKSLERALGKLASHIHEETSRQKDNSADMRRRVETGLEELGGRVSGVEGRIDKTLDEAAARLAKKVEQAELRTEGATKHLSGRFSDLETNVAQRLARLDDVTSRLDTVETTTSKSLTSMEGLVDALQARLDRAESQTNEALDKIDKTFGTLSERVSALADTALPDTAMALRKQFESRFEGLSEELRASIEGTRQKLASEIDAATTKAARPEQIDALKDSLSNLADALDRKDSNALAAIATLRQDMESSGRTSRTSVDDLAKRVDTNWNASQAALETLRQRFEAKDAVSPKAFSELRERMETNHDKAVRELAELRGQVDAVSRNAVAPETIETVQKAVSAIRQRLAANEKTSTTTLSRVSEQISQMSDHLGKRLQQVEDRDYAAQIEAVRADMHALSHEVTLQLGNAGGQGDAMIEKISAEMKQMSEQFEARVDESEKRSAKAIEQVGEQVSSVSQRLQARQERSLRDLEQSIESERTEQQKRLSDALSGVSVRMEEIQERSANSLSPVQKAIASLAARLEAFEDAAAPRTKGARKADSPRKAADDDYFAAFMSQDDEDDIATAPPPRTAHHEAAEPTFDQPFDFEEEDRAAPPPAARRDAFDYEADRSGETRASDPFAEFEDFDEADNEPFTGEEFAYEEEPADLDWDAPQSVARSRGGGNDYLSRARQAALSANDAAPAKAAAPKRGRKKAEPREKKSGKFPLLPVAAAAAIVAVGAGFLLGKDMILGEERPQIASRSSVAGPPNAGVPSAVDTTQDAGSASEDATSPDADTAANPSETVNSMQPSERTDALEGTLPADGASAIESTDTEEESLAGVSDPVETDPVEAAPEPERPTLAEVALIPEGQSLEQAAAGGDAIAQYQLGQRQLEAGDYTSAPTMIRRAAEQGLAVAQYRLAKLHESGLGVPRDLEKAREWTERGAAGGNVKAMYDLAVYYAEGEGGPQTYAGAAEWFRKAAEFGVTDGQYNLAVLHELGLGVSENPAEALYWYAVAANQGDSEAPPKVAELTNAVGQAQAAQIRARAAGWTPTRPNRAANGIFPQQGSQSAATPQQIAAVQNALAAIGHEPGPADGVLGAGTQAAIRNYERENGMNESGSVSPQLIESLNARIAEAKS
ncbi:peptidoglycan-binding protein [Henriciella marina]|uniref:Peptidoglycan-binding protein n=1 Tax=Henriciella marina TaxID=453851 RepID=A0ABT4LR03_9PROT|nr:peptidoglycan-binding protein [Henriciella marina]MCZ4296693.1 peptidoglycan-binding protein [Henriciella marina]